MGPFVSMGRQWAALAEGGIRAKRRPSPRENPRASDNSDAVETGRMGGQSMKSKFTRRAALKLAAAAVPAVVLGRPAFADPLVIKFSHVVTPDAPKGKAA